MTKRYIGFLLALCTLLTLCAPAFAAEADGPALEAPEAPAFIAGEEEPAEEAPLAPAEPALTEPSDDMPAEDAPAAVADEPGPIEEADEPEAAAADSGTCGADLTWSVSGGTLTIRGTGAMGNFKNVNEYGEKLDTEKYTHYPWFERTDITSVVIESGVTGIGEQAFWGLPIRSVTIPQSVTSIGESAFGACTQLTDVTLPEGITVIRKGLFNSCTSLRSVSIPDTVTSIGESAFYYTAISSITLPQSLRSIGSAAFEGCPLTSVSLPGSLTSIGNSAFKECRSLKTITVPGSVSTWGHTAFSQCTGLTSATLSSGLTSVPQQTFSGCTSLQSVSLPSSITSINTNAFSGCSSLQSITIPGSVTTIYPSAFQACTSLTGVTIPASVAQIGALAFADCTRLSSVTFAGSSTKLESQVFDNTPWMKAQGNFVVQNGILTYYQGPGGSVTIPGNVTSIDDHVFTGRTDITSVSIPSTVRKIGEWAFAESGLKSVTIPGGVEEIGGFAFLGCLDMASLSIPSTVTKIGEKAFQDCQSLTSVTIPEGVRTIGDHAFMECTAMHTITIPSTVTAIGLETFRNSAMLRKIIINGATFTYKVNASHDHDAFAEFLSPALTVYGNGRGSAQAYAAAMGLRYADMSQQHRNGWQSEGGSWYYYEDGRPMSNRWLTDGGSRYYLGADGRMLTGLQRIIDLPKMAGLYYFDPGTGAMKVGWQQVGGIYYYFNPDPNADEGTDKDGDGILDQDLEQTAGYGAAVRGWFEDGGDTFYMDLTTGAMLVGWQNIDGKRYYFNTSHNGSYGARFTGLHQIGGVWYEFNDDGSLKGTSAPPETPEIDPPAGGTGWRYVPETGDYYYFKDYVRKGDYWVGFADGASAWANNWYYADADGKLLTGFQYLDDLKGGKAWYMLQVDDTNGEIGKMLSGHLYTYTNAGWGEFSDRYGSQGMCTHTDTWGDYNASTGLWGDGQAHRG